MVFRCLTATLALTAACGMGSSYSPPPELDRLDASVTDVRTQERDAYHLSVDMAPSADRREIPKDAGITSDVIYLDSASQIFDGSLNDLSQDSSSESDASALFPPCVLPAEPLEVDLSSDPRLLYSSSSMPLVEVVISPENWVEFCRNGVATIYEDASPVYSRAKVRVSGLIPSFDVGIRPHGRTSLEHMFEGSDSESECIAGRFGVKPSFKISFNQFAPGSRFLGLKKLNLIGHQGGSSLLKEYLFWKYAEELGLPTPRVSHALLCVNGRYLGVYSNVQEADDQPFLDDQFAVDSDGEYYKIDENRGSLTYPSESPWDYTSYDPVAGTQVGATPADYSNLIDLVRFANTTSSADFAAGVDSRINVDEWLKTMALEMVLLDVDGIWRQNNYLMYRNSSGMWSVVRIDTDDLLGQDPSSWRDSEMGSRLFCYYWSNDSSQNNSDGTALILPTGYTERRIRHPVLPARLMYDTHTETYLRYARDVLGMVRSTFSDVIERQRLLIIPYMPNSGPVVDPFQNSANLNGAISTIYARFTAQTTAVENELRRLESGGTHNCP